MITKTVVAPATIAVAMCLLFAVPLSAQDFSPYRQQTGKCAYDQYNDALFCGAALERENETAPPGERHAHREQGIEYARNFALLMLESGDVVDVSGTILAPDDLVVGRENAYADWHAVLRSVEDGQVPDAEIDRCLRLYGHDWD